MSWWLLALAVLVVGAAAVVFLAVIARAGQGWS